MTLRRALAPTVPALALAALAASLGGCSSSAPVVPASATQGPRVPTSLTFTGAVAGTAHAVGIKPPGSAADPGILADGTTQCAFAPAGGTDAWTAQITVRTRGNQWQIGIGGSGFGNPKPGRYNPADANQDSGVTVDVTSTNPIAPYLASAGATAYRYYLTSSAATVTLDPSLTSGTIDVELTTFVASPLKFTVKGVWSCR